MLDIGRPLARDNQRAFSFQSQDSHVGFISLLHCSCFAKPSVRWEGSSKLRMGIIYDLTPRTAS